MKIRHNWTKKQIAHLFELPFNDLIFRAHRIYRKYFDCNSVQVATLLSIKTGACPEDCGYCSQSGHHNTLLQKESLMSVEAVLSAAETAKNNGATRFCMGAAWRHPPSKDLPKVIEMIKGVKALGMETCVTLGMLDQTQANMLAESGLDFYNHNLDTSPEYYKEVTSTRTYEERLTTIENVRKVGIHVCCGGIIGMGESRADRVSLLQQIANLPEHPLSVPINQLSPIPGTPFENKTPVDMIEFIRTVAVARIILPKTFVRLSAGRDKMSEEAQACCFFAGANSIHHGEKLLTTPNTTVTNDHELFKKLGLKAMPLNTYEH
ncbi:MAG: biotin synthase BioB [Gammaproteobacteria bacterium]